MNTVTTYVRDCVQSASTGKADEHFVVLSVKHAGQLVKIERDCFVNAWTAADFCNAVADPRAHCSGIVAGGFLCGYAIGYVGGGIFHLANFAIALLCRRRGMGARLLRHVLVWVGQAGCLRCTLDVRTSNLVAIEFYLRQGFVQSGLTPNFYETPCESALMMTLGLASRQIGE